MPRSYLRLDPHFYERKALRQGYPPGAVAALVGCLCLAETQPERGRFRDRRVLSVLLGPSARWIPFLVDHGDLIEQAAFPRLYVDGWDEWQEGDVTVRERMERMRNRPRGVTPAVTAPVTVGVTTHRQTDSVIAGAVSGDKGGDGRPYNGAAKPGNARREPERLPGEAPNPRHEGQHPDCLVCEPIRAAAAPAPARATARPRSAGNA
jgi:hypothetical protein